MLPSKKRAGSSQVGVTPFVQIIFVKRLCGEALRLAAEKKGTVTLGLVPKDRKMKLLNLSQQLENTGIMSETEEIRKEMTEAFLSGSLDADLGMSKKLREMTAFVRSSHRREAAKKVRETW